MDLAATTAIPSAPCIQPRGPCPNRIFVLGEAPGEQEEKLGIPFVGSSGRELEAMLREAGLNSGALYLSNVFKTRPKNNKLESLFLTREQWKLLKEPLLPQMKIDQKVRFLAPQFLPELETLRQEIEACNPNLIIALGNTALWSLTGRQNISSVRGTSLLSSVLCPGRKVLPTFHPAAVLRQWDLRSVTIADLMKAKRQSEYPDIRRPKRVLTINPNLLDLERFLLGLDSAAGLAVDVETRLGQITEIGFAPDATTALVVPFIKGFKDHYWSEADEVKALSLCRAILQHPVPKIFQNGLYDLQYIWRTWRFAPRSCHHDTMLRHHALFPEMQKGLGFLGSLYTDEPAWKMMRNKKDTQEKRDDE